MLIPSVRVPDPLPEAGETVSHDAPEMADQASMLPPEFATATVCVAGAALPSVYPNFSWVEESEIAGGCTGGATKTLISFAPVLLLTLRILQGFALGGEWAGAVLLAVEHSPEGQRGRFGAILAL